MMTDEQEIAIERLNRFKTIEEISYSGTFAMTLIQLERLQEAIETVLDMLKEKDKEIIKLAERANEYKKALTCKDCDCSICQAHINNLKLREENELAKEQPKKQSRKRGKIMTNYEHILISAVRYALGKKTYMVELTVNYILEEIEYDKLSDECLIIIRRDVKNAEDYGMECDRKQWIKLLNRIEEVI